jgi:malonyl-CoA O-methyltransferase
MSHSEIQRVRRAFDAAADSYDDAAVLQQEVGARLIERLSVVRLRPADILDIGAGTGARTRDLMKRYPRARVTAIDIAPRMLQAARRRAPWLRRLRVACADAGALPFARNSFDLVFSNLVYQWVPDLRTAFSEVQRVLRPDGVFMFSSFGPDTLTELRQAWAGVDQRPHVNTFIDMHDVGDALVASRLADPVMDMERFTLTYGEVRDLVRDLRAIGAETVTQSAGQGLTGPRRWRTMCEGYERFRDVDGRLPATWEVVYGHAWGTDAMPQHRDDSGTTRIPLQGLRVRRRGEAP